MDQSGTPLVASDGASGGVVAELEVRLVLLAVEGESFGVGDARA